MDARHAARGSRIAVIVLLLWIAGLAVGGTLFVRAQHNAYDRQFRRELMAAAEMTAMRVGAWREERLSDAEVLAGSVRMMPAILRVLRGSANTAEREEAAAWLERVRARYGYGNAILTNPKGEVVLHVGPLYGHEAHFERLTRETMQSPRPVFNDLHTEDIRGESHLGLNTVVAGPRGEPLGALLMGVDPRLFLYPTLRDWPGAGLTGEILLVRRDGDAVLYLNDARFNPESAMRAREPMSNTRLAAVRAVMGAQAPFEAEDYRKQPVIAAAMPVPGSAWTLVVKMDRSEAQAPQERTTFLMVALLVALALAASAMVGLGLRQQAARVYRDKYEAEMERKALLGHYDYLTRYANDAILLADEHGRMVELNDRAAELFGYSREELLGMGMHQLKPAEEMEVYRRVWKMLLEGKSVIRETRHKRKDGTSIPTEVSARLIEVEGRRYVQAIVRDITERRQAQQQIKRLNHLYAVLSGCSAAIVRARSEDDLFREVCRIAAESGGFRLAWIGRVDEERSTGAPVAMAGEGAGYLKEVLIGTENNPIGNGPVGTSVRTGVAAAGADFAADPVLAPWREAALRHGLRSVISVPLFHRGKTRYAMALYSADTGFFSAEETKLAVEVGASLSFALDRLDLERERQRAEQEMQLARERLELALDASNEGYWDRRLDTGETYLSSRYSTMLGYRHGELSGDIASMGDMIHPEDLAGFDSSFAALREKGRDSAVMEFRARHRDGHYVWILSRGKVVERDAAGRPLRIVGTREDITARKLLEQQFLQAQKLETVGRLAGGVAHDFNNHLTVINGYADMARALAGDGFLAESLDEIRGAGERAAALTRQLLAFSRKGMVRREPLDISGVIRGMDKMMRRLLGEEVQLWLDLEENLGPVMADRTHVEQVVMNLIVNARDAIQRFGVVDVQTRRAERGNGYVRITVKDNGMGMTPEVRNQIFEPFFTTKDKFRGTGLGLSTVLGIVDSNGGFIEVESEPGKGSSFHVFLPCVAAGVEGVPAEKSRLPARSGSGTILVVEDQPEVRRLAAGTLVKYGYEVLAAADGSEALAVAGRYQGPIDAIVSDVVMPGMTGKELVERLTLVRPQVKALFVSGYPADSIRPEDLERNGAMFLPKPYSPDALVSKLQELMGAATRGV